MEPKNNTAYSSQPSGNPYGASLTGASPNSPNSNKYRNWCIWGGLIIALLIVLGACCYHIIARDGAPVVVTDSLSTRLLQDSSSNNKNRIVQLTPEFIKAIEQYDELSLYSEGYAAVYKRGVGWGYIDTWGREVIPCKYSSANSFHEGLASVILSVGSRWVFIDTLGQVVIPPLNGSDLDLPGEFSDGRVVFMNYACNYFTVLDRQGNIVFRDTYDESTVSFGLFGSVPFENPALVAKYIDGKLYIPRDSFAYYRVYDTEGNRLKDASREEKEKIEKAANAGKGKAFRRTLLYGSSGWSEAELCLWGVKDSNGKVLIPAESDNEGLGLGFDLDIPIDLSNGVVPVRLEDYEGLKISRFGFFDYAWNTYYGYADLKGNDTFPKGLKERYMKAQEQNIQEYLERENIYNEDNLVNGKDLPEPATQDEAQVAAAY